MARQRLGQHFLIKGSILERIAVAACPTPQDLVIEIGPGAGRAPPPGRLLKRAARVVAVEVDPYLAGHLRAWSAGEPRLEVVESDVLETDLTAWGPACIAGTQTCYITSPILDKTARAAPLRPAFFIQKEVAQRLAARPGGLALRVSDRAHRVLRRREAAVRG